jgi:hypothetical protein
MIGLVSDWVTGLRGVTRSRRLVDWMSDFSFTPKMWIGANAFEMQIPKYGM